MANSDLLRCYMLLDPRVPQLVFIVRAWARAKGLTVGKQLSNYALTLMVLYFLQMRTPPVMPSLQRGFDSWIKELSGSQNTDDNDHHSLVVKQLESDVIDGWECSFFKDTHRLSMSQNDTSLSKYGCLGSLPVILIPSIVLCKVIRIPDFVDFCLWNLESWALESGFQLAESGIPLMFGIQNQAPPTRNPKSSSWNP